MGGVGEYLKVLHSLMNAKGMRALLTPSNYATGARLQESADFLKLYLLTGAREAWPNPPPIPDIEALPALQEQRRVVQDRVQLQCMSLISAWHEERPPALPPESPNTPVDDERRAQLDAERASEMVAAQRRAFGFELDVAASSAGPEAGFGVFVRGKAPPGSVVAIYPGVTYSPADVLLLPGGTRHFQGNEYLMARFDKCILDASSRALEMLPPEARSNPLAVAHNINHPPKGSDPNVMPAPMQFDSTVPAELLPLLPNVSYEHSSPRQRQLLIEGSKGSPRQRDLADIFRASFAESARAAEPAKDEPTLKGLAFVTTRAVEDEELFLNYRLNPRNRYPAWYTPYDKEEDARRWS